MRNKKILYLIVLLCVFFIAIPKTFAEYLFDGDSTNFGGCAGNEWCFSSLGIRMSLYTYDNELKYYGSKDYSAYSIRQLAGYTLYTEDRGGRVAYASGKITNKPENLTTWKKGSLNKTKTEKGIIENGSTFSDYNNFGGNDVEQGKLRKEIIGHFGLDSTNYSTILQSIKTVFRLTTDIDLSKAYITVEPTALIYEAANQDSKRYYGTIYELAQVSKVNGHDGSNIYKNLFKFFLSQYNAIVARNPNAIVVNNKFLSRDSGDEPYILAISDPNPYDTKYNDETDVSNLRDSNKGYGIGVFWVGEYASEQTCQEKCSSYNLNCYSNYCEPKSKNQSDKTNCMNKCGAKEPVVSCSSATSPRSTTSYCSDEITSSKTACKISSDKYYKEECTETTIIKYSDDLPTTLIANKGGFNFSAKLNGKKICKLTFNSDYYDYKYYMAYGDTARNSVKNKRDYFNNINNYKNKRYAYIIENSDYIKFEDRKLEEINNTVSTESKYDGFKSNAHQYSSTYSSTFELKTICYTLNGRKTLNCSDIKSYSNYYAVYNNSSLNKVNTKASAYKDGSGLNDDNKCYYLNIKEEDLSSDADCAVTIENNSSWASASVKYRVITRGNADIKETKIGNKYAIVGKTYKLSELGYSSSNSITVNASIKYIINGEEITKQCPVRVDIPTVPTTPSVPPPTDPTPTVPTTRECVALYKPAEYDSIREYCIDNWNTDIDGYTSFDECYKKCSSTGRENTCRTLYEASETEQIKDYCKRNYKEDGYKSVSMCINDCSVIDGGADYIYRPIATGLTDDKYNAFPNRKAGSNWIGYEDLTEDDSFNDDVIYEINLTPELINKIAADSKDKKKYIDYDGKNSNGYYLSDYITSNSDIFTNTRGRNSNGGGS